MDMEKEIAIAVMVWSDVIKQRQNHDAGDTTINLLLNAFRKVQEPVTEKQIQKFEQSLSRVLKLKFDMGIPRLSFGKDYDPSTILLLPCIEADISPEVLPVKSTMWIEPGLVRYKFGYGAPIEVIQIETLNP